MNVGHCLVRERQYNLLRSDNIGTGQAAVLESFMVCRRLLVKSGSSCDKIHRCPVPCFVFDNIKNLEGF